MIETGDKRYIFDTEEVVEICKVFHDGNDKCFQLKYEDGSIGDMYEDELIECSCEYKNTSDLEKFEHDCIQEGVSIQSFSRLLKAYERLSYETQIEITQ